MAVKVLIVDDHPLIREGLKKVLEFEPAIEVAAEASTAEETFEVLKSSRIDIILLDISLHGKSGLDIIKDIKELYPYTAILIISMHSEESFAIRSLKLGACGYLTKDSAPDDLIMAVKKIISGEVYLSKNLSRLLVNRISEKNSQMPHECLSDREFQVLRLLANGKTVSQIAEELFLSIATISTYRTRILGKMDMNSNAELTYYVISNNLGI
jgi:DNA-binding NarL/FixJ family response regulator